MKMSRHFFALTVIVTLAAFGIAACDRGDRVQAAREDRDDIVSASERDFMMKNVQGHLGEIDMARLAKQKSQNNDVKDFANMIEQDHQNALEDLNDIMLNKNVPPPGDKSEEAKQDLDKLNGLSGAEFDREYANIMVAAHQKTAEMLRDQMNTAQNEDVRDYVNKLLPKVEMHLQKAQGLQSKLFSGRAS